MSPKTRTTIAAQAKTAKARSAASAAPPIAAQHPAAIDNRAWAVQAHDQCQGDEHRAQYDDA